MRFGTIELWDTFFSFGDPKMVAGSIYGCLWLVLAVTLLVLRSRETRFPNFLSLSIYLLIGIFAVIHYAVMALINVSLPTNESVGLLSGPPLWLSAAGISGGLLLAWMISEFRGKNAERKTFLGSKAEGRIAGWKSVPMALTFSFFFPGMGQVYYGRYLAGLLGFLVLCFVSGFFKVWGFIAVFTLIQIATILNKPLDRLMRSKMD